MNQGWNFVWVVNFSVELYDPLRNTESLIKYYHLCVWSWAAATLVYVSVMDLSGTGADGSCYVKETSAVIVFFQAPIALISLSGIISAFYACIRLPRGALVRTVPAACQLFPAHPCCLLPGVAAGLTTGTQASSSQPCHLCAGVCCVLGLPHHSPAQLSHACQHGPGDAGFHRNHNTCASILTRA